MSINLVDATALDSGLDLIADAIRAKTGDSADIPWAADNTPGKGFADAIAAISSGGGNAYIYSGSVTLLESAGSHIVSAPVANQRPLVAGFFLTDTRQYGTNGTISCIIYKMAQEVSAAQSANIPDNYFSQTIETRSASTTRAYQNTPGNSCQLPSNGNIIFGVSATATFPFVAGNYKWWAVYADPYS